MQTHKKGCVLNFNFETYFSLMKHDLSHTAKTILFNLSGNPEIGNLGLEKLSLHLEKSQATTRRALNQLRKAELITKFFNVRKTNGKKVVTTKYSVVLGVIDKGGSIEKNCYMLTKPFVESCKCGFLDEFYKNR